MAKQTKKATGTKRQGKVSAGAAIDILPPRQPSPGDFNAARELLHLRASALILDLAGRYLASKAAELITVLDAIESLSEIERLRRPDLAAAGAPHRGSGATEGAAAEPTASGISLIADSEDAGRARATGTVKWFNPQKGFGFIVHTATGKDVFVHISAVEKAGLTKLNEGQKIEFELEQNRGKAVAVNLRVAGGRK